MSGEALVARRIADFKGDVAVRACLQALFTQELETADQAQPRYKSVYEAVIRKHAPAWEPPSDATEAET